MSVLIKGMKMPAQCDDCPVFDDNGDYPTCVLTGHSRGYNWSPFGQRMPDCPLIVVPPHGRLIDADALIAAHKDVCSRSMKFNLDLAPTIIEADESDMDSFIRIFEEDDEEDGMDSFIRILKD